MLNKYNLINYYYFYYDISNKLFFNKCFNLIKIFYIIFFNNNFLKILKIFII